MQVFGPAILIALYVPLMAMPAWCHEDDFSRHNRFPFSRTYWAKECERPPTVREPEHSVRLGQVEIHGSPIDPVLLGKSVRISSEPMVTAFGRPRQPEASEPFHPIYATPATAPYANSPKNNEFKATRSVRVSKAPKHPASTVHRLASRTSEQLSSPGHRSIEPTSYPENRGYSMSAPMEVFGDGNSTNTAVHAKLLPLRR